MLQERDWLDVDEFPGETINGEQGEGLGAADVGYFMKRIFFLHGFQEGFVGFNFLEPLVEVGQESIPVRLQLLPGNRVSGGSEGFWEGIELLSNCNINCLKGGLVSEISKIILYGVSKLKRKEKRKKK